MNRINIIALLFLLSGMPVSSYAAEKLLLTGAEVTTDTASYFFVGAAIPLPDQTLAHGFVAHLWADFQKYSYDVGVLETRAKVKSVSAAIGYHDAGEGYWWNAKIGAIHSNTQFSPDDPTNKANGSLTDMKLQLGGERHISSVNKINGILDYITDREAYWARFRFLSLLDNNIYHGPEVITQGDPSYDAQQLGWVVTGIAMQGGSTYGVKAGIRKGDNETSGYFGVELVVPY